MLFYRIVLLFTLLTMLTAGKAYAREVESDKWTNKYDRYFEKYSKRYFGPHFEWRWFKSQGIAESNLNFDASSPAGAEGIMQLMPATYEEIRQENPTFIAINEPRWNIAAGIFYDRQLYRKWRNPMPSEDRLFLAFSSYNAGYGRVLKAVKRTGKEDFSWVDVKKHLPAETRGYVARIAELMDATDRHRESALRHISDLFN